MLVREGKLWVMKPDGTDQKELVSSQKVLDFDWSPDGKHIAYCRMDGSFAAEVYVAATDGTGVPVNISRHATWNSDVTWSEKNGKIAFVGRRRGATRCTSFRSSGRSADGSTKPPADQIDWEDLHLRVERPTTTTARHRGRLARRLPGGVPLVLERRRPVGGERQRLVRFPNDDGQPGAERRSLVEEDERHGLLPERLRRTAVRPHRLQLPRVHAFGLEQGRVQRANDDPAERRIRRNVRPVLAGSSRTTSTTPLTTAPTGTRCGKSSSRWSRTRRRAKTCTRLVSLMMGELNASHLGISGKMPTPDEWTADLGLIFDENYKGSGAEGQ